MGQQRASIGSPPTIRWRSNASVAVRAAERGEIAGAEGLHHRLAGGPAEQLRRVLGERGHHARVAADAHEQHGTVLQVSVPRLLDVRWNPWVGFDEVGQLVNHDHRWALACGALLREPQSRRPAVEPGARPDHLRNRQRRGGEGRPEALQRVRARSTGSLVEDIRQPRRLDEAPAQAATCPRAACPASTRSAPRRSAVPARARPRAARARACVRQRLPWAKYIV